MKLFENFRKWSRKEVKNRCGILVASDQTQEWLLPWWWRNYTRHNSCPVSFVDLGLTEKMKRWCLGKGEYIHLPVPDVFVKERDEIEPHLIKEWEAETGTQFWESRNNWFKKPLACLQSPYEKTLWIDLDCEIKGAIAPCFDLLPHPSGLAMTKERDQPKPSPIKYNAGVILFQRNLSLIEEWADGSFEKNELFRGDQDLLEHLIAERKLPIAEIPPLYNWSRCQEDHPEVVIYHWHGKIGKKIIEHQIMKAELNL